MLCAKRPRPISPKRGFSPTPSMHNSQGNCWPTLLAVFQLKKKLDDVTIANFQQELEVDTNSVRHAGRLPRAEHVHVPSCGAVFQAGMTAYSKLQQEEFAAQNSDYRAITHQRFVGTGYFDEIARSFRRKFFHHALAAPRKPNSFTAPSRSRRDWAYSEAHT